MTIDDLRAKLIAAAHAQAERLAENEPLPEEAVQHAEAARALCEGIAFLERGPYELGLTPDARTLLGTLVRDFDGSGMNPEGLAALDELRELAR